jgi:uncharacterized membrane protein (GlpM family)
MLNLLFQIVLPFAISAVVVILITVIAEKYGTKIGGIIGTLPSTIVVAFVFIAFNNNLDFASESAAVVPAELGVNIIFLFLFVVFVVYSVYIAFFAAFLSWTLLSLLLIFFDFSNIYLSLLIFFSTLIVTFFILERVKKVESQDRILVYYTPLKIVFRGILAGIVIALAVYLSNFGAVISGIFSVFPAILTSTMIICYKEHGPDFASGMAKSMIFGISSVAVYATAVHFLYPTIGIIHGSIIAYLLSIITTITIYTLRNKFT